MHTITIVSYNDQWTSSCSYRDCSPSVLLGYHFISMASLVSTCVGERETWRRSPATFQRSLCQLCFQDSHCKRDTVPVIMCSPRHQRTCMLKSARRHWIDCTSQCLQACVNIIPVLIYSRRIKPATFRFVYMCICILSCSKGETRSNSLHIL